MPDRPGALGLVASRIGAVRGEILGIEILEQRAGRAIDEFVVALPDPVPVALLVDEINAVDGVDVDDVQLDRETMSDPRLEALETATLLMGAGTPVEVLGMLVELAQRHLAAGWTAVIDRNGPAVEAAVGEVPSLTWLVAFIDGSRSSDRVAAGNSGSDDLAWASLASGGLDLVVGRCGRPLHARERHQLAAMARLADLRWRQVSAASSAGPLSASSSGPGP